MILSIENHASEPFQKRMVELFKQIFGDKLFTQQASIEPNATFPSPSELQHKILVKNKKRSDAVVMDSARSVTMATTTTSFSTGRHQFTSLETKQISLEMTMTTGKDGLSPTITSDECEEEEDSPRHIDTGRSSISTDNPDGKSSKKVM